ncbi:unnamed protein product [Brachionus calyciflorus]|uniref:PH domain-containing protein n=1 Tax=Brachionus calyciflorus TaxID=104777 RepID=A0A814H7K8_9BILA|nr:unnamed protein product [Brachionus calyciflorus]
MEDLTTYSMSQIEQNNEENIINLEDLHDDTVLPQQLIDLLNKQSFNGTIVDDLLSVNNNNNNLVVKNDQKENSSNGSISSLDSLNCDPNNNNLTNTTNKSNTTSLSSLTSGNTNQENETLIHDDENYDQFDVDQKPQKLQTNSTIKRTHLINLIYELYDLSHHQKSTENSSLELFQIPKILVESFMEKLPPGKNLKNSILLAWKRRYFKLNSIGELHIHDIETKTGLIKERPDEIYKLMGGKVDFDHQSKIISLDDGRGSYMVFRCCSDCEDPELYSKWKQEIEQQIIDRSESLWVKPNKPLTLNNRIINTNRNVLIIDIGTCSIRAGLYDPEPKLPKLFVPTVCSKDVNQK